ncbi:hypothetical protein HMPREF9554_02729 [Treponema phagedenis F0421]|nr:hypothetical protein HMPREF9554_02729 [Treponema phagedenis F0421]
MISNTIIKFIKKCQLWETTFFNKIYEKNGWRINLCICLLF